MYIFSPFNISETGSFTSESIFDLMRCNSGTVNTILFYDRHCSRYFTYINSFSPCNMFLQIKLKHRQGYKASQSKRRHESVSLPSKSTFYITIKHFGIVKRTKPEILFYVSLLKHNFNHNKDFFLI